MIHPFSLSPTGTWVQQGEQGWWAPCIWCGFGIAALAGENAVIHARIGAELSCPPAAEKLPSAAAAMTVRN
jgi:Alkylmercury lyase